MPRTPRESSILCWTRLLFALEDLGDDDRVQSEIDKVSRIREKKARGLVSYRFDHRLNGSSQE